MTKWITWYQWSCSGASHEFWFHRSRFQTTRILIGWGFWCRYSTFKALAFFQVVLVWILQLLAIILYLQVKNWSNSVNPQSFLPAIRLPCCVRYRGLRVHSPHTLSISLLQKTIPVLWYALTFTVNKTFLLKMMKKNMSQPPWSKDSMAQFQKGTQQSFIRPGRSLGGEIQLLRRWQTQATFPKILVPTYSKQSLNLTKIPSNFGGEWDSRGNSPFRLLLNHPLLLGGVPRLGYEKDGWI